MFVSSRNARQVLKFKIPLSSPLKAIGRYFKRVKPKSLSAEYQQWRDRFLLERLRLAAWIALIGFSTLVILYLFTVAAVNATEDSSQAANQEQVWLFLMEMSAAHLCLLLCLTLLKIKQARRYPERLFFIFSWSITLLFQIQGTLRGEGDLIPFPWLIMFPAQAILIPVRWHLHLMSQLSVLCYYFSTNLLLGLSDPNAAQQPILVYTAYGLYIFWISLICDLGVCLYERVLRAEFELRQQLRVFFHAVSHDLRNPVVGTAMVLKNLLNQPSKTVQVNRSLLERMLESSDRQLDLINSLVEVHNTEVRGVALHCQPLQLSSLIQSVIDDFQPMLAKHQATVTHCIEPELPRLLADSLQLRRVYENLIANALKYNPPGLNLTLKAKLEGDWVHCTVADDGVGMSQEQCARLFDLYFRGSQIRQSVGLGLGLYLCRQIITAHGGEIGVNSRQGQGTSFWFTLPTSLKQSLITSPQSQLLV